MQAYLSVPLQQQHHQHKSDKRLIEPTLLSFLAIIQILLLLFSYFTLPVYFTLFCFTYLTSSIALLGHLIKLPDKSLKDKNSWKLSGNCFLMSCTGLVLSALHLAGSNPELVVLIEIGGPMLFMSANGFLSAVFCVCCLDKTTSQSIVDGITSTMNPQKLSIAVNEMVTL